MAMYGSHILSDIRKLNSPTFSPCFSNEICGGTDRPDAATLTASFAAFAFKLASRLAESISRSEPLSCIARALGLGDRCVWFALLVLLSKACRRAFLFSVSFL